MQTVQECRAAYAQAMALPSIREALARFGNAIYVDSADDRPTMPTLENRFVITRLMEPTGEAVLCNGVRCG